MHSKIVDALTELNIELALMEYDGNSKEYIIIDIYDEKESDFEDNENTTETYFIQLAYWFRSKNNLSRYKEIIKLMKLKGFKFKRAKDRKDGNYYGKTMDFIYKSEIE